MQTAIYTEPAKSKFVSIMNLDFFRLFFKFYSFFHHYRVWYGFLFAGLFLINDLCAQKALIRQSIDLYYENQLDSSIALLDVAFDYYMKEGHRDSAALARAHQIVPVQNVSTYEASLQKLSEANSLVNTGYRSSQIEMKIYQEALTVFSAANNKDSVNIYVEKIEKLIHEFPDEINQKTIGFYHWKRAYSLYLESDYPGSISSTENAAAIFLKEYGKYSPQTAASFDFLGSLYRDVSRFAEGIEFYQKSIEIADSLGSQSYNVAITNNNLASIYNSIGDFKKALNYNDNALSISRNLVESGQLNPSNLANFYETRANTYAQMRKYKSSISELYKAKEAALKNPEYYAVYLYTNIVETLLDLDSIEVARGYMKKAWRQYDKFSGGNRDDFAHLKLIESGIAFADADYDLCLKLATESCRVKDSLFSGAEYYSAAGYEEVGRCYCELGNYELADSAFHTADTMYRALFENDHRSIISVNFNRAKCLVKQNKSSKAESLCIRVLNESGLDFEMSEIDWNNAFMDWDILPLIKLYVDLLFEEGRTDDMRGMTDIYIKYLERFISHYDSYSVNVEVGDIIFNDFADFINYESKLEHLNDERIFRFVQKAKTIQSRVVLNDIAMTGYRGVPDSIVAKEIELKNKLNIKARQLVDEEYIENRDDAFHSIEREYRRFRQSIKDNYPDYYSLKYQFDVPSVAEVRRTLKSRDVWIEYFLSDAISLAVVVDIKSFKICKINTSPGAIDTLTDALQRSVLNPLDRLYRTNAMHLYRTIIQPLQVDSGRFEHFIILPDRSLNGLSFEMVMNKGSIYPLHITYAHSANQYLNPVVTEDSKDANGLVAFAPSFTSGHTEEILPQPFSREMAVWLKENMSARVYRDESATETRFKEEVGSFPLVHLSTHGVVDDENPLDSYLLFFPDSSNDGRLSLIELYNLNLESRMAALNACSTAKGVYHRGVGLASLASGFMYAGCSNLISSSWAIDDRATSVIMRLFYDEIRDGKTVSESIYFAKLNYLKGVPEELKHPYYWAGLTVTGTLPVEDSNHMLWFFLFAFGVIVLAAVSIIVWRRRH